jgi:hypothetical protein
MHEGVQGCSCLSAERFGIKKWRWTWVIVAPFNSVSRGFLGRKNGEAKLANRLVDPFKIIGYGWRGEDVISILSVSKVVSGQIGAWKMLGSGPKEMFL